MRDFRTEVINAILKSTMDWFNSGKSQPMPYDALADGLIRELGLREMEQELAQVRSERDNALGGWDQEVRSITQLEAERDDAKFAAKKARAALAASRTDREELERVVHQLRAEKEEDGTEIERLIKARDDARHIAKQYHDQAEELDAALATASATLKLLYEAAGVSDSTEPEVVARDIQDMAEMAAKHVNNTIARAHSDQEH